MDGRSGISGVGDGDDDDAGGDDDAWLERWHVARSVDEMRRRMPPDCDTDRLLTDFPNLLVMDVPALFEDLARVFPDKDPGEVLRRNPSIAYQVNEKHAHTHVHRARNFIREDKTHPRTRTLSFWQRAFFSFFFPS